MYLVLVLLLIQTILQQLYNIILSSIIEAFRMLSRNALKMV